MNKCFIINSKSRVNIYLIFIIQIILSSSCVNYKKIPYFTDVPDSAIVSTKPQLFTEPKIQFDDILSISINTLDMQSNNSVNMPSLSASGGTASAIAGLNMGSASVLAIPAASTYRVNKQGDIDLPLLGKTNANGYTTTQLKDTIQKKLSEYFKMPTVDVRFTNFRVTVLGEVMRPGTYAVPNEKITILDALGLSGDLTIFGKRENVLLIRDSADIKQMIRVNLNSKALIASPFYFLKQNDVIYVEPTNAKIANLDAVQNKYISIASAVLSVLIILATRLR